MKASSNAWSRSSDFGSDDLDDELGGEQTSVSDNVVPHFEENLEEPTMRAGTDSLLASAPRPGTLDEPTVDRSNYAPAGMQSPEPEPSLPAVMIGKLVVIAGNDNGNEYTMTGMPMTIGRALGNDIVLTDIAVSRKHMTVEFNGRQYKLVDHGSGNGTLINDRLETGSCLLHHGDRLELGKTIFRFEHPATRGIVLDEAATITDEGDEFDDEANTVVGHSKPNNIAPASTSEPVPRSPGRRRKPVTLPPPHSGDNLAMSGLGSSLPLPDQSAGEQEPLGAVVNDASAPIQPADPYGLGDSPLGAVGVPRSHELPRPPGGRLDSMLPVPSGTGPAQAISQPSALGGGFGAFDSSDPMLAGLPGSRLGSELADYPSIKKSRRGLVIGMLAISVIAVGVAIGVILTRSSNRDKVAEKPRAKTTARTARSLPLTTWGTNETALVASTAKTTPKPKVDGSQSKPEDVQPEDVQPEDAKPEDVTPEDAKPEDAKPEDVTPENVKPEDTKPPPKKTVKKKKKKTAKKSSSKSRITAARNSAKSKYKSKQFSAAAKILRDAAGKASKKDASSLRSLASKYETIGSQMSKGNSNQSRNAPSALSAYEKAYRTDKQAGSAHSSFLRGKLQVVAPKAAASHMAKKRYEAAKSAADKADAYGAGKSSMVKRVRANLETKAKSFYKSALKDKNKQPARAKKTLQRILKMVPKSSQTYGKALKLISKIK